MSVLLNNGNGTFGTAVTYDSGGYLAVAALVNGRSRKRHSHAFWTLTLLCLSSAGIVMSACGGSSKSSNNGGGGTPPGNYNLTVTGSFTSGSSRLTHTTKLTLVVQ